MAAAVDVADNDDRNCLFGLVPVYIPYLSWPVMTCVAAAAACFEGEKAEEGIDSTQCRSRAARVLKRQVSKMDTCHVSIHEPRRLADMCYNLTFRSCLHARIFSLCACSVKISSSMPARSRSKTCNACSSFAPLLKKHLTTSHNFTTLCALLAASRTQW